MEGAHAWNPDEMEEDEGINESSKGNRKEAVSNEQVQIQEHGFMAKIGNGLKYFWSTRQTVESGETDVKIKTTLRELIIYIVFLLILCIMTFGMMSGSMFYYNQMMTNLFLTAQDSNGVSFQSMTCMTDVWNFIQGPLLQNLYPQTWYNGENLTSSEMGYVVFENKLLGVPRIRQVKVRNNSCIIPDNFQDLIQECYDSYTDANEFKHSFGLMNGTAWTYQTSSELKSSSYSGQVTSYSGGGFTQDLALTLEDSTALVQPLYQNLWIDRGTRAVIIDFTVYNGNINLFCVMRLVVEMPPTGGVFPSWSVSTVKLLRYVTPMDYFVLACEVFFVLFLIYYSIEEILEIKIHKLAYFKCFWNILDVVNLLIGFCCCVFDLYRTVSVNNTLDKLLDNPDKYANFVFLSSCQDMANSALAVMVFFCWVKIFKYISFNKTMTQLSSTLSRCAKDLAGFAVMFIIFFIAFAQLGYLLFGAQDPDYESVGTSILTLFRLILGDFDFATLQQTNRILGPLYFVVYVFFVFFILLNMFLAIINDTYSEVKSDLAEAKNEFEMGEYFKQGAMKMMDKLNIKREKLMDIQDVMKMGDSNNDGVLDFDEWRHDMKKRGYADAEIEAVFAKYDTDGDRGLDTSEQNMMQADLEKQKIAIDSEMNGIGEEGAARGVPSQELVLLQRRVSTLEESISNVANKVEAVLNKLDAIEKAKSKRKETMGRLLDSINETDTVPDPSRREYMSRMIRDDIQQEYDAQSYPAAAAGSEYHRQGARPKSGQE